MRNTFDSIRRAALSGCVLGLLTSVCHATDYYIWKGTAVDSVTAYSKYNVANSSGTDTGTAAAGEIPSGSIVFIPNNKTYHVDASGFINSSGVPNTAEGVALGFCT